MSENYRLVALDMDGTLLNTAHQITPYTREVLHRAALAGKVTALCTGRCLSELWKHLELLPDVGYVICENGACVFDIRRGRAVRRIAIPEGEIERILALSTRYDLCRQMFSGDQSYIECADAGQLYRWHIQEFAEVFTAGSIFVEDLEALWRRHLGGVEKINLYFADEGDRRDFLESMRGRDLRFFDSIGLGLEVSPAGASKAEGLRALCGLLDIPIEQAMAVGDGGNDLEIMGAAGLSVAMGNAIEAVTAAADVTTDDCDHDGAAKAIERFMAV